MPDFIVLTRDCPEGPSIRSRIRPDHLEWLKKPSDCAVLAAGPWLDDTDAMRGSLLIVKAPSRGALDQWLADDPYAKAGLPEDIDIRPFNFAIGRPAED